MDENWISLCAFATNMLVLLCCACVCLLTCVQKSASQDTSTLWFATIQYNTIGSMTMIMSLIYSNNAKNLSSPAYSSLVQRTEEMIWIASTFWSNQLYISYFVPYNVPYAYIWWLVRKPSNVQSIKSKLIISA